MGNSKFVIGVIEWVILLDTAEYLYQTVIVGNCSKLDDTVTTTPDIIEVEEGTIMEIVTMREVIVEIEVIEKTEVEIRIGEIQIGQVTITKII